MENTKKDEEQEKGFVVRDKRFSATKEEHEPQIKEEPKIEETSRQDTAAQQGPLPEIDFSNFTLSLSTSALIQLGEIQDPFTQKISKNLPLAKQTIDLIAMLKEKTKGNLSPDEERVIEYILYDLRMRYVKAAG